MNSETRELVAYRLGRAKETIDVARLTLEHGHLKDTVNRLYYACFYAVSALLLAENLSSSKHSGVLSLFIRHWIQPERLPSELSRFYKNLFKHRQQGDYLDLVTFDREDVDRWLEEATNFIARISEEIELLLNDGGA